MHDAIEFEKRGIPAAVVITEAFRNAALFQFRSKDMEGHPFVVMPHPISNLTPTEMKDLTLRFADEVAGHLMV